MTSAPRVCSASRLKPAGRNVVQSGDCEHAKQKHEITTACTAGFPASGATNANQASKHTISALRVKGRPAVPDFSVAHANLTKLSRAPASRGRRRTSAIWPKLESTATSRRTHRYRPTHPYTLRYTPGLPPAHRRQLSPCATKSKGPSGDPLTAHEDRPPPTARAPPPPPAPWRAAPQRRSAAPQTSARCAPTTSSRRTYSEEVSLLLRQSAASRSTLVSAGDRPPNVSTSSGTHSTPSACARA